MKLFCCFIVGFSLLFAEEILLKNGNRLFGKVIQETENTYVLETGFGLIHLKKTQVHKVLGTKSLLEQYWEKRDQIPPDDIEQLWFLSLWCEEKGLENQRDQLYHQILSLNPNHLPTRQHLGHRLHLEQWITPEEYERLHRKEQPPRLSPPITVAPQEVIQIPEPVFEEVVEQPVHSPVIHQFRDSYSDLPFYPSASVTTYLPYLEKYCKDYSFPSKYPTPITPCENDFSSHKRFKRNTKPSDQTTTPTKRTRIPIKTGVDRIVRSTRATVPSTTTSSSSTVVIPRKTTTTQKK